MRVASIIRILRGLQISEIQSQNLYSCAHIAFESITLSLRGSKQQCDLRLVQALKL
jgi:hypothetical protein